MLFANTPTNSGLANNLLSIEGDPSLAAFAGSSAIWTPADPFSGFLLNGLTQPSAFLANADIANSDFIKNLRDWLVRVYVQSPTDLIKSATGESKPGDIFDWKFWAVSIGLALLGLIFVLGGVLSFR